ncbi:hypothetical protein GCM10009716_30550 [Streptomyces sodiiphilus]|uniref:Secreted protein n=1 Tax=Streptomyces sodiiphilus TaxID=226217 RepID=A0ABP5AQ68_9ACTN
MAGNSHGNTPAAWTGVVLALIGFSAAGVFMVMAQPLGVVAGLVVVALGGVATLVMNSMGLGSEKQLGTPAIPPSRAASEPEGADGEAEKTSV